MLKNLHNSYRPFYTSYRPFPQQPDRKQMTWNHLNVMKDSCIYALCTKGELRLLREFACSLAHSAYG